MSGVKIVSILLVVAGAFALIYGRLTFTRSEQTASFGPIGLTVKEKESINIPTWIAVGAIIAGTLVFFTGKRGYRT